MVPLTSTGPRSPRLLSGQRAPRAARVLRPVARPALWIPAGGAGMLAVAMAGLVLTRDPSFTHGDLAVDQAASLLHAPALDWAALLLNWVFAPGVGAAVVLLAAAAVWLRFRDLRTAVTFAGMALTPWFSAGILKEIVQRERPDPFLLVDPLIVEPASFSFPSGHTALAAGLALAVGLLARGTAVQSAALVLGVLGAALVGASRVWIGVHYPADVIASLLWSGSVTAVLLPLWLLLLNRHRVRSADPEGGPS